MTINYKHELGIMRTYLIILLTLLLSACSTMRVQTHHDNDYSLSDYRAFAFIDSGDTSNRFKESIRLSLSLKGYSEIKPIHADMLIRYTYREEKNKNPRPGTLYKAFLKIDVLHPTSNAIIWSAEASDWRKSPKDKAKDTLECNRYVNAIMQNFPQRASK